MSLTLEIESQLYNYELKIRDRCVSDKRAMTKEEYMNIKSICNYFNSKQAIERDVKLIEPDYDDKQINQYIDCLVEESLNK